MDKGVLLRYYKREDIQKALVSYAKDREIAISYCEKGYGKRPDILEYPRDVIELVKEGASSFHVSEEIWINPKQLNPMLKRIELNSLRKGWDLVLDIDSPFWKLSKIITWLLIKALKDHNIKSVSCKFSGNKGFHIGVPFEAFPEIIDGKNTSDLFPDAPRAIAGYLLDYIDKNYIKVTADEKIKFGNKFATSFQKLKETTKKDINELTKKYCSECNKIIKKDISEASYDFICPSCEDTIKSSKDIIECPKCKKIMHKIPINNSSCECGYKGPPARVFDSLSIIDVDTLLISSRHLYRMPYSINEKSGLTSIIISPSKVLDFEKKQAVPEKTKITKFEFLNTKNIIKDEAKQLIINALEFMAKKEETSIKTEEDFDIFEEAAPKEVFPPCITNILKGLKDGKKRSLFLLTNFLICCGWTYDKIEALLREWNSKNEEPLREVLILGQLRYHKQQKKKILPPNCINQMYYKDMQICKPNQICKKIKNPVNYAKRKVFFLQKADIEKQPKREKLTEEQKEMRRKYKEKLKEKK